MRSKLTLAKANQHWQGLAGNIVADSVVKGLSQPHATWLESLDQLKLSATDINLQLRDMSRIQLANMTYLTTITEKIFAGIDFGAIQNTIKLPEPVLDQFQTAIDNMTVSYSLLSKSLTDLPEMISLPNYSLPGATRDMFLASYALQTICPAEEEYDGPLKEQIEEVRQETAHCCDLLCSIEPTLVKLYTGAYDAFNSKNVDRARHIMVSLRELWSHLLRHLAPDDLVEPWAITVADNLLHRGRPTRIARILYLCRGLNHEPLSEFITQDTKALVELMEVFHRIHELEPYLTDDQLYALLLRSDSWILYLLRIYKER